MFKNFSIYIQYVLPQRLLTFVMGQLAEIRLPWLKNYFIRRFIKKYSISLKEAVNETPESYPTFNDFFIRRLKSSLRPIAEGELTVASPVDGITAQLGQIKDQQLIQAKGVYFSLETLCGKDTELVKLFRNGSFATFYLAPHNYHRVHMPLKAKLCKTVYVPGKLFSVNRMTSELVPNLYGRNERLIALFETEGGPMAVILVGAMIVGKIQTVWSDRPIRSNEIHVKNFEGPVLEKGSELGYFKLGSTVILLYPENSIEWAPALHPNSSVCYGQFLGNIVRKS